MADLEIPEDLDGLCLARGDEVDICRPLFTGDVIEGVTVPVLASEALTIAVLSHPCSMRAGARLAPFLHVAPVRSIDGIGVTTWQRHYKVMPLGAIGDVSRTAIHLDQTTLVPSDSVDPARRVFCASRPGINLLRQRLVHHLTRVVVETRLFDEEAAGAHEEVDLMEDWLRAAVDANVGLDDAAAAFHEWIRADDGDRSRQARLIDPQSAPAVRRAARFEMRRRYDG